MASTSMAGLEGQALLGEAATRPQVVGREVSARSQLRSEDFGHGE
jgi:hypothetical protein